ncbi:MAG: methyltransferase domain-containing protein [Asgard group archaeon]|nr:methyltransferase domain-containing protein [Asgard group archaeon]
MRIPKLNVKAQTFTSEIWDGLCSRYGDDRANNILSSLAKPVKHFAIRTNLIKVSTEHIISKLEEKGWKCQQNKTLPEIVMAQTKGMNPVPYLTNTPRVIMDKVAAENVYVGSNLFGVGIRRIPKINIGDEVSLISPKDQIVATGIAKIDSKTEKGKGIAVKTTNSFYNVPSIREMGFLKSGEAFSQSLPAAYVTHVLDPREGETVVDLCAAPGGKSTGVALLTCDKANIIAFDRSKKRLLKMEEAIRNHGFKNIRTIHGDSLEYIKNHTIRADKVIVDPSCTALGVRPKLYDETTIKDSLNAANYQKSFLWAANKITRTGGVITYSTCTIEPRENEEVIAYAVNELGLKLVEPTVMMGSKGEETDDGLEIDCMRRFYPDTFDTPGFFIAKLMKK